MHACGHDVHMAALVALARAAHALGEELPARAAGGLPAERGGLPLRRASSSPRGELAAIAPAAVVAAHVHPELPWGTRRARPRRRQRLERRRRDHRRRASPRTAPTRTSGATRSSRSPQIVVALHAQVGAADRPAAPGRADGRRARGGQRRERDPRAGARARGSLRAHRPRTAWRCASWSRRSSPASPPRTAAARSVAARSPASRRSRTTRGIVARARELLAGAGLARGAASGAPAARTTSPSSARSRRSRWRSSGSTAPRASRAARFTTPSSCRPTAPSARSRARRPCCTWPRLHTL